MHGPVECNILAVKILTSLCIRSCARRSVDGDLWARTCARGPA